MVEFTGMQKEPIAERKSDIYGAVKLYAPDADPTVWSELPWMIETEHGEWRVKRKTVERINPETNVLEKVERATGVAEENRSASGVKLLVNADAAHKAYERLGLLSMQDLWEDETAEVMSVL